MTTVPVASNPSVCGTVDQPGLSVVLRLEAGSPVLGREPVMRADLADAIDEFRLQALLRKGILDRSAGDFDLRVAPVWSPRDPAKLLGFALEAEPFAPGRPILRREFTLRALEDVARRIEATLRRAGVLKEGQYFHFGLELDPGLSESAAHSESGGPPAFDVTPSNPATHFVSAPVAELLSRARALGGERDDAFPLFYTEEAFANAEQSSRKGAQGASRHESGAILAGSLGTCPESGEFFVVVTDAFEMKDTEATLTTLELSGSSWVQVQAVLQARQTVEPATRILGQAHGHPFKPGEPCAECARAAVCSRTNVHPSAEDAQWMRAVFAHQPWAACHIFGLTAREDLVSGLFSLHDGRLLDRHFHLLPDFNSRNYPTVSVSS